MRNETLRARWDVLRQLAVPAHLARDARTSANKFSATVRAAGRDPAEWPHLLNSWKGIRKSYSTSKSAIESRERRAALKAAGLDWVRVDMWSRGKASTAYAMRQAAAGRDIPEKPSLLRRDA